MYLQLKEYEFMKSNYVLKRANDLSIFMNVSNTSLNWNLINIHHEKSSITVLKL